HQCGPELQPEIQLLIDSIRGVGQGQQKVQASLEVRNCFHIGRAKYRALTSSNPPWNGFAQEVLHIRANRRISRGGGEVLRYQLGCDLVSRLFGLSQNPRDPLVVVRAGAVEQRFVCHVLDQRVLEAVDDTRWQVSFDKETRLRKLLQIVEDRV